jgi:predicted RNA-binding protein with PIN domain
MREAWRRRTWIVDGHNTIFAVDALSHLQQTGERHEARRRLEGWLRPFAERLARPLCIVYDGNRLAPNPDALDARHLRTLYSQPPEEADDRIVYLAQIERQNGRPVTVVSNDRRSLIPRLPAGVVAMSVEEFFRSCVTPAQPIDARAAPPGDYQDVARHFIEREPAIAERARRDAAHRERTAARRWQARIGRPATPAREREGADRGDEEPERWRPAPGAPPPPPSRPAAPAVDERAEAERLREAERQRQCAAKRERGARRQRRRLEQLSRRRRTGKG